MSADLILETRALEKSFGGVRALASVSFGLERGELRCLIGPNGAGKSTFFKLLTGQIRPSAGAIPFATKGTVNGVQGYRLVSLVRADSPYQKLSDLKGKRVAHTSPSSNSGNLAPLVLYPKEGLTPNVDYKPIMSGGHDKSALGVLSGDYDMGGVASDVYERMVVRGTIDGSKIRIIYKSEIFPTSSFAYAHDLKPELADKIKKCFYDFRFTAEMQKEFNGDDRFVPITYIKDWKVVREIAEGSGTPYNKAAYEKESAREAAALKKKQEEKAAKEKAAA